MRPCPKWNTSCALAVLVHETVGCPIPHFSIQKGAHECPRYALLPSLHWGELRSRLLTDSQSGITSRECGLRGRPEGLGCHLGQGQLYALCKLKGMVYPNIRILSSFIHLPYVVMHKTVYISCFLWEIF